MANFLKQMEKLERSMKVIPKRAGIVAVNFSKQRFVQQNWIDGRSKSWAKRKTSRGSKSRNRGAVLIDSGRLKRSIRIVSATTNRVVIGTDVPYAQAHNDGFRGTITVKAHIRRKFKTSKKGTGIFSVKTRKERTRTTREATGTETEVKSYRRKLSIPQRQFLGNSAELARQIERNIAAEINKALK